MSTLVFVTWSVIIVVTFGLIGLATYAGLRSRYDILFWRRTKLLSAFLGVVGLLLLLVNLEKTIRDSVTIPAKAYLLGLFNDTKFLTNQFFARVCSHENDSEDAKRHCSDARNLNNHLNLVNIWDARSYEQINYPPSWQTNPDVSEDYRNVLIRTNDNFARIKMALPASNETSFVDEGTRMGLLAIGAILVGVGLAGSIGEAAYQLAQTKRQLKTT
jgi:hypothetical protein